MTHKPIVQKLLAHYTDVYERVERIGDRSKIRYVLFDTHTKNGVCWCADKVFNTDIYNEEWVQQYGGYWGTIPKMGTTKIEILQFLKIRIDNLTTELELINKTSTDG